MIYPIYPICRNLLLPLLLLSGLPCTVSAGTPAPKDASLYIISPAHGEVVHSPVTIRFGLRGMGVAPAGIDKPDTGHHHLLLDVRDLPLLDQPLPADQRHRHFGGGQTQTTIELPPGRHTLQLLLGDSNHIPHEPPLISEKVTITVE